MAIVTELNTYPVKGCAGVAMTEALIGEAGPAHDRSFMVVGEDGVFRSQRGDPRLATIRPEIDAAGERLVLRAEGVAPVEIEVDLESARCDVSLFGNPYQGIDQGADAAGWLSEVLGSPSRLVRVPPEHARVTPGLVPGTCGYADAVPVHVISQASLDELNRRLDVPLPTSRFRPNIVVAGWGEPHGEDLVRHLTAGNVELAFAKLSIRCAVTTVDQVTAVRTGPEPLRTLAEYRRNEEGGIAFGAGFAVVRPGKLTLGDEVKVRAKGKMTPGD